jgi:2-amino-4-hydroxy-6-hydroxymethyldihydropteridine diphosphokinase
MSELVAFIGLGANLGQAASTVKQALKALESLPGVSSCTASALYSSDPVNAPGPTYVNAVARLTTPLAPEALLQALQSLEQAFGRERSFRNAPRTLDLDLLWHGGLTRASATLTLPHPRMHERAFVLKPLLTFADGDLQIEGKSASQWLADCKEQYCIPIEN